MTLRNLVSCTACGYTMDSHDSIDVPAVPSPGDFSLCLRCGALNIFDRVFGVLLLKQPTVEQSEAALADPRVVAVRAVMKEARRA